MDLSTCISTRRSIREYEKCEISENEILEIVKAGQLAPSWKNTQSARYYAVISTQGKEKLLSCLPNFNKERTKSAGAFIVTTVKKGLSGADSNGIYFTHLGNGYECFDNGLAVENMLLKANDMGYGSLIMGLFDKTGLEELLSVPDDEELVVVVALGKKGIFPAVPPRKEISEVAKII